MPELITAYKDRGGAVHLELVDAQLADIVLLLQDGHSLPPSDLRMIAEQMLDKRDELLAILGGTADAPAPKAAAKPARHISLAAVLERVRRHTDWNDDELVAHIADNSVLKVKHIGNASFALLQQWAAGRTSAADAATHFKAMHKAVDAA